ncbi:MAG: UDP-glucose 4-epimerase [Alphaproteobacteria bacterium]|jgi:UDP-glucose 4-epimerase|nr:UDP-glucose 4-epimerase [Alphaproteobacteria bacterium]
MTVLVTGGAGYIGSHTVHALADAGERVIVLDNLSTGFATALPKQMLPIVGDVGDQALVASLIESHEVDSIIHFAGSTIVPESMKNPLGYYGNNTANSRALIEAAVKGGVRHFIFSSTAAVYGNPVRLPVAEDDPTVPLSPYGWSKLMTEIMLRDASAAHGLRHVVLRYFNVAGADPQLRTGLSTPGATHLIKVAVEAALGRRARIDVYGTDYPTPDGTCIRDFIHVSDLARAHLAALNHLRSGGASATLNCGYGRGYSIREVLDAVRRSVGHAFPVNFCERRQGDIVVSVAAATRIRELLNWTPELDDLDAIVGHALAWERRLLTQSDLNDSGSKAREAISA